MTEEELRICAEIVKDLQKLYNKVNDQLDAQKDGFRQDKMRARLRGIEDCILLIQKKIEDDKKQKSIFNKKEG